MKSISSDFFKRDTVTVAKKLLGKKLVRVYRGKRIAGIITEVEAYLGTNDKAAHSYGGRNTKRVQAMYLEGGHVYVYFIYGMYHCLNIVTRTIGTPEAVLIRAIEPIENIGLMQKFRHKTNIKDLSTGPGKLAQALNINMKQNELLVNRSEILIEPYQNVSSKNIVSRPRIGVAYAGEAADWPLRFYIKDSQFISKR